MSECICAKECTATEHEYPQIDSDETFLDLLTELTALRAERVDPVALDRTTNLPADHFVEVTLVHKDNANTAIILAVREALAEGERAATERIVKLIERLGSGYENQHGKEREVIDDVLYEIREGRA